MHGPQMPGTEDPIRSQPILNAAGFRSQPILIAARCRSQPLLSQAAPAQPTRARSTHAWLTVARPTDARPTSGGGRERTSLWPTRGGRCAPTPPARGERPAGGHAEQRSRSRQTITHSAARWTPHLRAAVSLQHTKRHVGGGPVGGGQHLSRSRPPHTARAHERPQLSQRRAGRKKAARTSALPGRPALSDLN